METPFSLLTRDNYLLNGILDAAEGQPAKKAVVIAHGLPCSIQEDFYKDLANTMTTKGYDVIRFGFYDAADPDARRLDRNVTLDTMQQDLSLVVRHFAHEYRDVFVAGHSYGGLIAVMANPKEARAICLFDSTLCPDTAFSESDTVFDPEINAYRYSDFVEALINPELVHQANALTEKDLNAAAAKVTKPVQLIYVNDGIFRSQEEEFFAAFQGPKSRSFLDNADHFFTEGDSAARAMAKALDWFDAHGTPAPSTGQKPQQRYEM